mgnify:CR=1 FL=1
MAEFDSFGRNDESVIVNPVYEDDYHLKDKEKLLVDTTILLIQEDLTRKIQLG